MKRVTLKKLTLENWRAQNRDIDFSCKTIVRGANGAGKSTVTDAFFWLLTGVDAQNRTNYDLYDNTKEFTPENAEPAVVEGVFDIDGVEYTFKREAKQKWTRKRGTNVYEKAKSDDYTYYIDGLAVSAKSYNERIEALFADIDKLKLMLNVRHYQILDWKVLRKHFADMVGVVSKDELKGDYSAIAPLLAKYENDPTFKGDALATVKEKLRQQINPLKDSMERFDSEIKGMKAMLPDLDGVEEAKVAIEEKRTRIEEIDREIVGMGDANKPFIEKRNAELAAIAEKKRLIELARQEWDARQNEPIAELRKKLFDLQSENCRIGNANNVAKQRKAAIERQIEAAKQQYEYFDKERDRLKAEKEKAVAAVFDDNRTCPTCGQPLPDDMVAQMKKDFYETRDETVAAIIERGKKVRAMRDEQSTLIAELEAQLNSIEIKPLLDAAAIEADIESVNVQPYDDSALMIELKEMEDSLTVVPVLNTEALLTEKATLDREIQELQKIVAKESRLAEDNAKITAKESEASATGVELAKLEGLFNKCVEREREWASIVRDRANKYLHYCKVEMTELNKSGDLVDVCTITIDGVDVGVANTARQIIAGIDIAEAFQQNAGLNLPLFIDNAEQICDCNIPAVDNQVVLTYVDDKYPELTIIQ